MTTTTVESSAAGKKVPLVSKLSLGSTRISNNIINLIGTMYYFTYFVTILGLDPLLFMLANFLYLFWNTLNDLAFGMYADRTTHKLGRRIPFIRYGSPFVFIGFIFLWIPIPGLDSGLLLFFKFLFGLMILDSAMTIVELSIISLLPELTEDNDERNNMNLINSIFYVIGGMGTLIIPTMFAQGGNILITFLVVSGVIASLIYFLSSYLIKERKELHSNNPKKLTKKELLLEIKTTFQNKAFLASLIFSCAFSFILNTFTQYSRVIGYIFGQAEFEMMVLAVVYGPAYIGYVVFKNWAKKVGTDAVIKKVTTFAIITILLLFLIDLLFTLIINLSFLYIGVLLCNGILFGLSIFGLTIDSDALDYEELNSGERKESMYSASKALFVVPIPQVVSIITTGILILFTFNFTPNVLVSEQTPMAIFGIKILISFIPVIMGLLYLVCFKITPLKGAYYEKFKQDVLKLHEEKEANYKEM